MWLCQAQGDTSKQDPEAEDEDNSAEQAKIDAEITQVTLLTKNRNLTAGVAPRRRLQP